MKKKIMIFMLLLSFLIGVGVPNQAKAANSTETTADDVKYKDIEDFMFKYGYDTFQKKEDAFYFVSLIDNYLYVTEVSNIVNPFFAVCSDNLDRILFFADNEYYDISYRSFKYYNPQDAAFNNNTSCLESFSTYYQGSISNYQYTFNGDRRSYSFLTSGVDDLLYSDSDIYFLEENNGGFVRSYDNLVFESSLFNGYSFSAWCTDAGLTCVSSSNESSSVIPFWYEPDNYNYIVRKTLTASSTSGVYQMTMLQKSDGAHYPYYFEVNDIGYLGVAGAFVDTSIFTIRNFYYDAEGNGWKLIERFDVSTLPFDNTNVIFDENVVFIYSDTDIYADRAASSVWQPASTEYYNVDIPEPEITRVPVNPGTGSVGGQVKPGGMLDFIITFFTLVWTKLFAVEVPVDGYQISFQAIVIFGAIAGVLIWLGKNSFGKKG